MWAKCKNCGRMSHITKSVCSVCILQKRWDKQWKEEKKRSEKERLHNLEIEPNDPFFTSKCDGCQINYSTKPHMCPYKVDMNGDYTSKCNCCDDCVENCLNSI